MKKYILFAITAFATLAISCNKEVSPDKAIDYGNTISVVKSFKVVMPETKAYLGANEDTGKKLVKFSDGDEIALFANTTGHSYTAVYNAASDEFTTSITDESDTDETAFYAVYPASFKDKNGTAQEWAFSQGGIIAAPTALHYSDIAAVENGVDESLAIMLASVNTDGALAFRYGVSFIKLQVAVDNVKSISFDTSSKSARYGGRPTYSVDSETIISDHGDSQKIITIVSNTSFSRDTDYYVPIIPKNSSNGVVTLKYTLTNGVSKTISTPSDEANTFYKLKMVPGNIYNLGCPPIAFDPSITADNIIIEQDATSGEIVYEILNPSTSGSISSAIDDTYDNTITNLVLDDSIAGKVLFTCDANNSSDIRFAKVIITYTYGDSEIAKEVLISQKGSSIDYEWNFSESDWQAVFAEYGDPNNDITNWAISYNGLSIVSTAKSKYNTTFFQWGGKGSTSDRYAKFYTPLPGTLIVGASNTGDSEDLTRMVTVTVGSDNTQSLPGGYKSSDGSHIVTFTINAGDVYVYPTGNGLRFYSIEFHSN